MAEISSPWAYTENASEKRKVNRQIYEELRKKYKIATSTRKWKQKKKFWPEKKKRLKKQERKKLRIKKMWLENGCKESPEEMAEIIKQEYRGRE